MIDRCRPKDKYRIRYHDRGISVCEEWKWWPNFADWALANGWEPWLEIDRTNNDKGYSPDNCRFVDKVTQNRNRDMELVARSIRLAHEKRLGKPFMCKETGEVFVTQIEAQRRHGVDRKTLRMALKGIYEQAGGLHWAYTEASGDNAQMNSFR